MIRIITGPTVEPVTLSEAKAALGIPSGDTASDVPLTRRISEARLWAESFLSRSLMPQTIEMRWDRFADELALRMPPVVSVSSVQYIDDNGALQTMDSADYVLDTFPMLPFVRLAYGESWPSIRDERHAVRVQYKTGYTPIALEAAKTISAITQATPGVVTSAAHGYSDGDLILLDVAGMTELDDLYYRVYAKTTDTFQLAKLTNDGGISTVAYTNFASGTATRVQSTVPELVRSAIFLLIGHWTNYQTRLEAGNFITRVPVAIEQLLGAEKVYP